MRDFPIPVQVRSRFRDGHWARGFEITEVVPPVRPGEASETYRVRRRSDGAVLPVLFGPDDVRSED